MSGRFFSGLTIALIALFVFFSTVFTVPEGKRAILTRLGDIVTESGTDKAKVLSPGIHFKLPIIYTAVYFDIRLQNLDVESSRILTAEQKYLLVDYYAKWRIEDIPLYYTRTGGYSIRAQNLLKQKINDALRAAFGKRTIREVVSDDRLEIMENLQKKANESAQSLGISVIDVRIRGIDLPQGVREAVFKRMSTEREQVATRLRAQGMASAEAIRADADAKVEVNIAKAKAEAQQLRASGDGEAADIYTKAYSQNAKFYSFYRSLLAYQHVFKDKNTIMVLKPDGEFFKYFNSMSPKPVATQSQNR